MGVASAVAVENLGCGFPSSDYPTTPSVTSAGGNYYSLFIIEAAFYYTSCYIHVHLHSLINGLFPTTVSALKIATLLEYQILI